MGDDVRQLVGRWCQFWTHLCFNLLAAAVIATLLFTATSRFFVLDQTPRSPSSLTLLRSNISRFLLQDLPPYPKALLPPFRYSQPMVAGKPEYNCTDTWYHPCSQADKRQGPPLLAIKPGRLSQEDRDMLHLLRKFRAEREAVVRKVKRRKVAYMFLTKGPMPLSPLWERYFQGHEGHYSIYVHTSPGYEFPPDASPLFKNAQIRSEKVAWGSPTMIDAERRLLGVALMDPANHRFVLLSESCIPVTSFDTAWFYLMTTNHSFVANFYTKQRVCAGRYDPHMAPEIRSWQWRKSLQWLSLTREHALLAMEDDAIYNKMEKYCRGDKWHHHCYADEHYFPTLLHIKDPGHLANRTITFTDFGSWSIHPRSFNASDITPHLIRYITEPHDLNPRNTYTLPCSLNGVKRTCFLFARKFAPDALPRLLSLPRDVLGF